MMDRSTYPHYGGGGNGHHHHKVSMAHAPKGKTYIIYLLNFVSMYMVKSQDLTDV